MPHDVKQPDCAFAMLDVLGFKSKLNSASRIAEFTNFLDCVEEISRVFGSEPTGDIWDFSRIPGQDFRLYSDTFIFTQEIGDGILPCDAVVSAASFFLRTVHACLERQLLVRGAISFGVTLTADTLNSIAGPSVNECAEHYELGEWVGCHLAPSAASIVAAAPDAKRDRMDKYFSVLDMPVRTKSSVIMRSRQMAINWIRHLADELPKHHNYLLASPLKDLMTQFKTQGGSMRDAVIQHFTSLLNGYAAGNAAAKAKIDLTLKSMGV